MAPRPVTTQARLEAVLYAELKYLSGKRTRRNLLTPGDTKITVTITATVGRSQVEQTFAGTLQVAGNSTAAASCDPDPSHVVAYLLGTMSAAARARILAELPVEFEKNGGELPPVTPEGLTEAGDLLTRLRASVNRAKKGAVVFALDTPTPDDDPADDDDTDPDA